jgi:glycosyltransferase involved in cell wall biosynthesis
VNATVIVCTYNRCESLAQALRSIASSVLPDSVEWEVLVVDNNSRDQTRTVVEEISCHYPGRFRYLFEPRQGLSNARNAGISAAGGQILVFTDDDVTVDRLWLQNLTAPLLMGQWAGAAGRIRLESEFRPPRWMAITGPFNLGESLVQFDRGDQEGPLDQPPFGANMAFRKIIFEKYGGFRADLGRCGESLIGNEDTEFAGRLMAAGERLYYVPSAVVNHPVHEDRLKKGYFRSYYFAHGRSVVRQTGNKLSIWRIPRYCLREIRSKLRWISSLDRHWFLNTQGWFFCELLVLHTFGEIVEGYRSYYGAGSKTGSKTAGPLQKPSG